MTVTGGCLAPPTLGVFPTPVQEVPGLPRVHVKREDLSGFGFGGSKIRLLDSVVAAGRDRDAGALVTGGRRDSNWVPLAMMAARREGWQGHAVFDPTPPGGAESSAVRLARRLSASVSFAAEPGADAVNAQISAVGARLEAGGTTVTQVPRGGLDATAVLGYGRIVDEVLHQLSVPASRGLDLIVPIGSGGLAVGLALRLEQRERSGRVVAVAVSGSSAAAEAKIVSLSERVAEVAGDVAGGALARRVVVVPRAKPSEEGARALSRTVRQLGLLLDPVFGRPTWSTAFTPGLALNPRAEVVLVASGGIPTYLEEVGER